MENHIVRTPEGPMTCLKLSSIRQINEQSRAWNRLVGQEVCAIYPDDPASEARFILFRVDELVRAKKEKITHTQFLVDNDAVYRMQCVPGQIVIRTPENVYSRDADVVAAWHRPCLREYGLLWL